MGGACNTHEMRNAYKRFTGKPEPTRPLGRPSYTWENNIKLDSTGSIAGHGGLLSAQLHKFKFHKWLKIYWPAGRLSASEECLWHMEFVKYKPYEESERYVTWQLQFHSAESTQLPYITLTVTSRFMYHWPRACFVFFFFLFRPRS